MLRHIPKLGFISIYVASGLIGCAGSNSGSTANGGAAGATAASGGSGNGATGGSGNGGAGTAGANGTTGGASTGGNGNGGASTGGSATGGTTGVWRPYSDSSPWNTLIGQSPTLDPDSATMITDFVTSSQWPFIGINMDGFSVPLYWADSSTPKYTVTADLGGSGWTGTNGFNATAQVPIPAGSEPDPQSDAHMLIVDKALNMEWGFYGASHTGTTWNCTLCATSDLSGDGVRPPDDNNSTWWTSHGPRACGFSLVAGLIRIEEMQAGHIDHALVIAYPHVRSGWYVTPASTSQASNGAGAEPTRGIPCGGRIQLDPSLDLNSMGLTASGKIIARALQEYGAYVGDYSGAMSLYAENSAAALAIWHGGLLDTYEVRDQIQLSSFRVLKLPTLHDGGNG